MAKLYVICSIDRRIGHAGTEDKKIGEVICEVVKPNRGESVPNNRVFPLGETLKEPFIVSRDIVEVELVVIRRQ
jgi:hypothetical protein